MGEITNVLEVLPTPTPKILIFGDFNLPRTVWPHCVAKHDASPSERDMTNIMSEFISLYFLSQLVSEPTHKAGNTLDIILTND